MRGNPGLIDYMTLPVLKEVRALHCQHAACMRFILCNAYGACVVSLVAYIIQLYQVGSAGTMTASTRNGESLWNAAACCRPVSAHVALLVPVLLPTLHKSRASMFVWFKRSVSPAYVEGSTAVAYRCFISVSPDYAKTARSSPMLGYYAQFGGTSMCLLAPLTCMRFSTASTFHTHSYTPCHSHCRGREPPVAACAACICA